MNPIAAASLITPQNIGEAVSVVKDAAKAAGDFESLFASMMLKEMRKSLDPETLFGGDSGDVYGGLFDQFLGQQIADGGGFGLARMVKEALEKNSLPKIGTIV